MEESFITLKNINKIYPNGAQAVFDFSLDIKKKEFVVLVGPSGCGKSTTLRMIAGLEDITSGEFYIEGNLSNYLPSKDRKIAMVFQSYALYPNMTVYDNIAFGLKIQKVDKENIQKRVYEVAKILDLGSYLDRYPKELSGGQMQRVALGRAIVRNVPIFLMDEPLSNLDAKLRVSMRSEIVRIHQAVESTTIYVTHDQVEAMTMADKIVVMNKGFIQQIGKPDEIYMNPNNSFVATFIGTPAMNLFYVNYRNGEATLSNGYKVELPFAKNEYQEFLNNESNKAKEHFDTYDLDSLNYYLRVQSNKANLNTDVGTIVVSKKKPSIFTRLKLKVNDSRKNKEIKKFINELTALENQLKVEETEELKTQYNALKARYDELYVQEDKNVNPEKYGLLDIYDKLNDNKENEHQILVGVRPEKIKLVPAKNDENSKNSLVLTAEIVELLGSEYNVHFTLDNRRIIAKVDNSTPINKGDKFIIKINPKDLYCYDLITGKRI